MLVPLQCAFAATRAAEEVGPPAVATVGQMTLGPGAINIVPGSARFTMDTRHPDANTLAGLVRAIETAASDIAELRQVDLAITPLVDVAPALMDEALMNVLRSAVSARGFRAHEM